MDTIDWVVLSGGIGAIAWVQWYFFLAPRGTAVVARASSAAQEVLVLVRGGYEPAKVHVARGVPVRLTFDRQETSGCSEEVVLPDFGVKCFLPAFEKTVVEFTPERAGTFEFTCGMGLLRGRIVVEADQTRLRSGSGR